MNKNLQVPIFLILLSFFGFTAAYQMGRFPWQIKQQEGKSPSPMPLSGRVAPNGYSRLHNQQNHQPFLLSPYRDEEEEDSIHGNRKR